MTNFEKLLEFENAFNGFDGPPPSKPIIPADKTIKLRIKLIAEEFDEVIDELSQHNSIDINLANLGKELADLLYVVYGTGVAFGLPMDKIFAEVHRSNMSKLGEDGKPIYREDGKALKGPNYTPANIERILNDR